MSTHFIRPVSLGKHLGDCLVAVFLLSLISFSALAQSDLIDAAKSQDWNSVRALLNMLPTGMMSNLYSSYLKQKPIRILVMTMV
jgi:hypothetical protein